MTLLQSCRTTGRLHLEEEYQPEKIVGGKNPKEKRSSMIAGQQQD
jgi:hypothetical protein